MDCLLYNEIYKTFSFSYNDNNYPVTVTSTVPIPLPPCVTFREYVHKIIESNKIPNYLQNEFMLSFKAFVDRQMEELQEENEEFLLNEKSFGDLNERWEKTISAIQSTTATDNEVDNVYPNELTFSSMYHSLIHSGLLTSSVINLEHSYNLAMLDLISNRDRAEHDLHMQQTNEMENAITNIGVIFNEEDINALSAKHFENAEKLHETWNEAISNMKESQRKDFRNWIARVYEGYENKDPNVLAMKFTPPLEFFENFTEDIVDSSETTELEESFTINLGGQLKTNHNLRLISADILDFCKLKRYCNLKLYMHFSI